jgi:nucleoside-diphosphate-sugar epimerase
MKSALVCGAGGFVGSHLVKRLKRKGFWVRGGPPISGEADSTGKGSNQ